MIHELTKWLAPFCDRRLVIVGIGNPLKGDDGVGPLVCRRIQGRVRATVIDAGTVPENYIGPVVKCKPEVLILIDAIDYGELPGTIRTCEPADIKFTSISTHIPSLRLFIEAVRQEVDTQVYIVGIQPAHTALTASLSPDVNNAVDRLCRTMIKGLVK
jgi:hydrogenase 3 maturation protease